MNESGDSIASSTAAGAGPAELLVGLDVGSTTVKAVVVDPGTLEILWKDYERHETRQPEKVLAFLERIEAHFGRPPESFRVFITGSGGGVLADVIGAKFVQEVNAVSLAVEHFFPDAGSVIELGGQDAKIIIWIEDPVTGQKRKLPSMNDKCAGGTGAVIDKIRAKLGLSGEELSSMEYDGVPLHPVAGKCGVFAETDINGLQKQGVSPVELMASLFDALVQQNLSVLTRGNTVRPAVLLLGGPNTFVPALQGAWRHHIPRLWEERRYPLPDGVDPRELIIVPDNAQYYASLGSVLYGREEEAHVGRYHGCEALLHYVEHGRDHLREATGIPGLVANAEEQEEFTRRFARPPFEPAQFQPGQVVDAYVGIDGGSTSTKGVLLDAKGRLLAKAYRLSAGNPIADSREILAQLEQQVTAQGATMSVRGMGVTGYAKDVLKDTLGADVAVVETVAHTISALHYYKDVDVICDVGGQDIKVIVLSGGKVKDFKLNTQCSAGNGYFLQSTAQRFGYEVEQYAETAFAASRVPSFSYGCAVFMETDIVNFQQLGWSREEIMAGLAAVLPKNIWLYVVQEPNLGKLGRRFVLQGGTQYNLAAVKAQYDFIRSRVPNADIFVHQYCGESGAIGAAIEALRVTGAADSSAFIGFEAARDLEFTATRDESTRCYFCKNKCLRTFINTTTPDGENRRFIVATCEKGTVEDVKDMRSIKARLDEVKKANPDFAEESAKAAFRSFGPRKSPEPPRRLGDRIRERLKPHHRRDREKRKKEVAEQRANTVIGMPRALNMYSLAPFFTAYFESLGLKPSNLVFSDFTDEAMWKEGSRRGSIDQCFPSKAALAHVHQLVHGRRKPGMIFFPALTTLPTELEYVLESSACPTVAATPEVVKAAFTKEGDAFAEAGIRYYDPVLAMADPPLFERQMLAFAAEALGVTPEENAFAIREGWAALARFRTNLRVQAREVLEQLEREHRVGLVLLGRPYHNDPGLNHEILESIQSHGYPIFTVDSLPTDPDILDRLFGDEVARGAMRSPMDIRDVWKNAYSENSNRKLWGAKYVARHPNLVALDLSSFKCGHDAPMYAVVEGIVSASNTPYFTFHDIDENKPSGSIKIRVETIAYFLSRYEDQLMNEAALEERVRAAVAAFEERLRRGEVVAGQVPFPGRAREGLVPLGVAMSPIGGGAGSPCGSCTGCGIGAAPSGCPATAGRSQLIDLEVL